MISQLLNTIERTLARWAGHPYSSIAAMAFVLAWALSGPIFAFSDTWQLIINTSTTVITFMMVFVIQGTQNRDTEALQVKLDELIRVIPEAREHLIHVEDRTEAELDHEKAQM